jgi:hypothetical protein
VNFIVPGSALLLLNNQYGKPHVWFILTDPDASGQVLAVMLCTRRRHSDTTTILAPGEYSFGDPVEGAIDYGVAKLCSVSVLEALVRKDRARMCESLSAKLLERVLAGLKASGHVPNWVAKYLDP